MPQCYHGGMGVSSLVPRPLHGCVLIGCCATKATERRLAPLYDKLVIIGSSAAKPHMVVTSGILDIQ